VPVKSLEQQRAAGDTPGQAGVRRGEDCDQSNRLRGLLCEFEWCLPLRSVTVRRQAAQASENLPDLARRAIGDLLDELRSLDERIAATTGRSKPRPNCASRHSV